MGEGAGLFGVGSIIKSGFEFKGGTIKELNTSSSVGNRLDNNSLHTAIEDQSSW